MKDHAHGDVWKVWAYAALSIVLGAIAAPWIHNLGKALEEITRGKRLNIAIDRLAQLCRDSDYTNFYQFSIILAFTLLLFPLISWLSVGTGAPAFSPNPWRIRLPHHTSSTHAGQPLRPDPHGPLNALTGFVIAAGLFLLLAWLLTTAGSFRWQSKPPGIDSLLFKLLPTALATALILEFLFRGIILGVFLRAMRPSAAISMSALIFALILFLQPSSNTILTTPDAPPSGLNFLAQLASRFADPKSLAISFIPFLAMGSILAYARWRTSSLWLPFGLHAGWSFTVHLFAEIANPVPRAEPLANLLSGQTLQQGLLPLGILALTAFITHLTTQSHAGNQAQPR